MNKVIELSDSFNMLSDEDKYKYSFSIQKTNCLNIMKTLKYPAAFFFTKYFVCGAVMETNMSSLFRLRKIYLGFLRFDAKAYKLVSDISILQRRFSSQSIIQRFVNLEGFFLYNYGTPIIISRGVLESKELEIQSIEKCIKATMQRIAKGVQAHASAV